MINPTCPLCNAYDVTNFHQDKNRIYIQCRVCRLIFVPAVHFLSEKEEKARYDLHQNNPEDPGYRQFLNRLFDPLQERLDPISYGLDFGSGPGPTLSLMFEQEGHSVEIYDYYYARNPELLENQYDFITATEVVEHLHHPRQELDKIWNCLKPEGNLGIMTRFAADKKSFADWHYKRDPTHVCFFSQPTFEWLAKQWQAQVDFIDKDIVIFCKKST